MKTNGENPVLESARHICKGNPFIRLDQAPIPKIGELLAETLKTYTPQNWRDQSLHHPPVLPYDRDHPSTRATLDWLLFISTLNFSFWSDAGSSRRFAVEWQGQKWDGYWSLLATVNRALEAGVPMTSPAFYGDPAACSDERLRQLFAPCADDPPREDIPLLDDRISFLRQVGAILNTDYGGSYMYFVDKWQSRYGPTRTALQLVQMVVEAFPCYRDQYPYEGRTVYFWKRAQILVAETWAAFHPIDTNIPHPLFPNGIRDLTMFADYRVPQLLMHYGLLVPSPALSQKLAAKADIMPGSDEEIAIRGGAILSVHLLSREVARLRAGEGEEGVSDVMIDFWLWDEAKRLEKSGERMPEAMRVRGFFY